MIKKDIRIKQKIIFASIILLPVYTIEEQLYFYGLSDSKEVMTQGIKLIKDLMFVAIYLVSIFYYLRKGFPKRIAYFIPFYILLIICFVVAPNMQAGLAGIRWCHIFFLGLCLNGCLNDDYMMKIGKLLRILLIFQIISQVFELFYMPPIQGINSMGLANRVSGIFVHPSAAGAFASVNYLFIILYKDYISSKVYKMTFIMILVSQIMAMSSTGIAVIMALYFFNRFQNRGNGKIIIVMFILLCPVIISNLDLLSGRAEGSNKESGGTRLEIINNMFHNAEFISTKFGLCTNTAVSMDIRGSVIADSSYTSLLGNVGLLGLIYITIPMIYIFLRSINTGNKRQTLSMIWIIGVSLPIVIQELFPFNLIIAILLNYLDVKSKNNIIITR